MHGIRKAAVVLAFLLSCSISFAGLKEAEKAKLKDLDSKDIQAVIALAEKFDTWKNIIQEVRNVTAETKAEAANLNDEAKAKLDAAKAKLEDAVLEKAFTLVALAVEYRVVIDKFRRLGEKFEGYLKTVEKAGDTVKSDDLRATALAAARRSVAKDLVKDLEALKNLIDELRNPAAFAKGFTEKQLKQEFLDKPYAVGEFRFRLAQQDYSRSVFNEEANIGIIIAYGDTGIEVQASGLYFEYSDNGLPIPNFDSVNVDESALDGLANKAIDKGLAEILPTTSLGPITISSPEFLPFDHPDEDLRGSLRIKVNLKFDGILDAIPNGKLAGDAKVVLYSNRKPKVVDPHVEVVLPIQPPVMLGPYLKISQFTMKYDFSKKLATIRTAIEPVVTDKSVVYLDLGLEYKLGDKMLVFEGDLRMLGDRINLAKVKCEIANDHLKGDLWIPVPDEDPLKLKKIVHGEFHFLLNREGLTADGLASLFGCVEAEFDLVMRFNGHGSIVATKKMRLGGSLEADSVFTCKYTPGFRNVELHLTQNVSVDLKLFTADAFVRVDAVKADSQISIVVVAEACGEAVQFKVDDLDDVSPDRVAKELLAKLGAMCERILEEGAAMEKEARHTAAAWEAHWKDEASRQFAKWGLDAIKSGDPEFDRVLGDISKNGKKLGGWAADLRAKSGGALSDLAKNPEKAITDYATNQFTTDLNNLKNDLKSIGDAFAKLTNPREIKREKERQEKKKREIAEMESKAKATKQRMDGILAQLLPLTKAINEMEPIVQSDSSMRRTSSGGQQGYSSNLNIRFMDAFPGVVGEYDGQILFTVRVTGYQREVNTPADVDKHQGSSDVKAVLLTFRRMVTDDGKPFDSPIANLSFPAIKNDTRFPAQEIARTALLRLIEQFLPQAEIDGDRPIYTKQLEIVNSTGEPVVTWVSAESRVRGAKGIEWGWLPERGGPAYKVEIPVGKSVIVKRPVRQGEEASAPVYARRIHLWAESKSGVVWDEYRNADYWLVPLNPQFGNERVYHADKPMVHKFELQPKSGLSLFNERLVAIRNNTNSPLEIRLSILSGGTGNADWVTLPDQKVPSQTTLQLYDSQGQVVRAKAIKFVAVSGQVIYHDNHDKPVWLIDHNEGRMGYVATKIGKYIHTFDPIQVQAAEKN